MFITSIAVSKTLIIGKYKEVMESFSLCVALETSFKTNTDSLDLAYINICFLYVS